MTYSDTGRLYQLIQEGTLKKERKHHVDKGYCAPNTPYIGGTHQTFKAGKRILGGIVSCPCCQDVRGGSKIREKFDIR